MAYLALLRIHSFLLPLCLLEYEIEITTLVFNDSRNFVTLKKLRVTEMKEAKMYSNKRTNLTEKCKISWNVNFISSITSLSRFIPCIIVDNIVQIESFCLFRRKITKQEGITLTKFESHDAVLVKLTTFPRYIVQKIQQKTCSTQELLFYIPN